MISTLIKLSEKKLIPDSVIRYGIRTLLRKRIGSLVSINPETNTIYVQVKNPQLAKGSHNQLKNF